MFKYIYEDENEVTCFDKYFDYIETIKDDLSLELYQFASDCERYELSNKKSLHDSWLKSLVINEGEVSNVEIELLGNNHDRLFKLYYSEVKQYYFNKKECIRLSKQDDLLVHEVRLNDKKEIEHVIEFDNEISFIIVCSSMEFEELIIDEMGVN